MINERMADIATLEEAIEILEDHGQLTFENWLHVEFVALEALFDLDEYSRVWELVVRSSGVLYATTYTRPLAADRDYGPGGVTAEWEKVEAVPTTVIKYRRIVT